MGVSIEAVSGAAVASEFIDLAFALDLERFETGSSVTMRALGAGKGAISIFSRKLTRLRQDMVGFMVVGRVRVDVRAYPMVPRSNCAKRICMLVVVNVEKPAEQRGLTFRLLGKAYGGSPISKRNL